MIKKPDIRTLRDMAARAGVNVKGRSAKEIRYELDEFLSDPSSRVNSYTCLLDEFLTRAGA